jgi:hypothetical protein
MAPEPVNRHSIMHHRPSRVGRPLGSPKVPIETCLSVEDHSTLKYSAVDFFRLGNIRDPLAQAARLSEQFEQQNRSLLSLMDSQLSWHFEGSSVNLHLKAGSVVGAIPLLSPTSAAPDYGLIIRPRFPWGGIGPMLAEMGWKIVPVPLKLPLLKKSERRVPPWVVSSMVLSRLQKLLDSLTRRFELITTIRSAPRGRVNWSEYAIGQLSRAQFLHLPCTYPDLRDDRSLKGAIRFTLEKHLSALGTQREHGKFIHDLISVCESLLVRVREVPSLIPSRSLLNAWLQRPIRFEHFSEGLRAIEWTLEERGLAGLSDLEGLPWMLPMEQFYEAWVETVFSKIARQSGALLRTGRKRETTKPITWDPQFFGSQKALVPDMLLTWQDTTLVVDAKYKRHWEEFRHRNWRDVEQEFREQHRNDLMQALAYANLSTTQRTITCLAYPCSSESWAYLKTRGRVMHKAKVGVGLRELHLWLAAVPMAVPLAEISDVFIAELRREL